MKPTRRTLKYHRYINSKRIIRVKKAKPLFTKKDGKKLIKDSVMKTVPMLFAAVIVGGSKKLLKLS